MENAKKIAFDRVQPGALAHLARTFVDQSAKSPLWMAARVAAISRP
jgi:hypothetical protein